MTSGRSAPAQDIPLRVLLLVLGLAGLLLARNYGESWDELKFFKYADSALQSYITWPTQGTIQLTGNTYDNYGPAYVMAVALGARILGLIVPWSESDLRHLLYFISFLAGIWAFYQLAVRWMSRTAALGATVFFVSQPLFWGHAFISPKDIPFLTFFLLSLLFGFRMVESFKPLPSGTLKPAFQVLSAFWIIVLVLLFAGTAQVYSWLDGAVRAAAAGEVSIISRIATDIRTATPVVYVDKFFALFIQLRAVIFWASFALLLWIYRREVPAWLPCLGKIAPAALFLGINTGIRVLGPLAGILVILYALYRKTSQVWLMAGIYAILAILAMYATWPYLWPDPIGHLIESVTVMARYPWEGRVLFDGTLYNSTDIPRRYLPVLLAIQLTEPVWVLFAAGLGLAAWNASKDGNSRQLVVLSLIWFVLPLLGFIGLRSPLYDNFRQVFFILPTLFLLAGVVIDKIKRPAVQAALVLFCTLPGVIAGIRLHPYEYIYYNSFIGGETGAFRQFELDYWGTSYREAAGWLNEKAPANASIWVEGPAHLLETYLRPDLKVYSTYEAKRADHYDYVVATSRYNLDLTSHPKAERIHTISRGQAVLAVIKKP